VLSSGPGAQRAPGRSNVPINASAPEIAAPGPTNPHMEDHVTENRSNQITDARDRAHDVARSGRRESAGLGRTAHAIIRLARARCRLEHLPTVGQVRAMAWFDGREPCSYLLDRAVNFVPEPMEFGYDSELGRHALCFTCRDPYGQRMELVAMRDGDGFDLLGGS